MTSNNIDDREDSRQHSGVRKVHNSPLQFVGSNEGLGQIVANGQIDVFHPETNGIAFVDQRPSCPLYTSGAQQLLMHD